MHIMKNDHIHPNSPFNSTHINSTLVCSPSQIYVTLFFLEKSHTKSNLFVYM